MADCIQAKVLTGAGAVDNPVTTGYCCDLLSRVMAQAPEGCAWMTVLTHTNIVAVAELVGVGCIIIPENIPVPEATLQKAEEEGVCILSAEAGCYEISWRLHEMMQSR